VAIDKSGQPWVGSEPDDVREYLVAYKAERYEVQQTRMCRCGCGSQAFRLEADRDEGCARRTCTACGAAHFICDSAEYWEDATPEGWKCTQCGNDACNLGVGFSLYEAEGADPPDVRWISVGGRCTGCGTLGSFVDWKVGYGPSNGLIGQA
jgi:hypothetical protein